MVYTIQSHFKKKKKSNILYAINNGVWNEILEFGMRFLLKGGSFKTIEINWSPHGNMTLGFLIGFLI